MLVAAVGIVQLAAAAKSVDFGQARIYRVAFVARVTHDMARMHADDLGLDEQRVFKARCCLVQLVGGVVCVHEQVRAGLQLTVNAAGRFKCGGAGAAACDQRDFDAFSLHQFTGVAGGLDGMKNSLTAQR